MTRRVRFRLLDPRRCGPVVLAVALVVLVASACGGSAGTGTADSVDAARATSTLSSSDAEAASAPQPNDDAATTESVVSGGTSMAASSPIGAFFDGGFDDALAEYTTRVEESIVVCMAAQGFEFAVSENGRTNEIEQRQNELTTREWTAQYGFGISTSFDSIARNQTSDPNVEIFFSMSASEREIWSQTLSGGDIGDAVGGDFTGRPLEDQGCIGQALIETGGQEAIEGLTTFGDAYEEGEEALFDTREMVEATDAWARCMSQAGFPSYADLDDPEDDIRERLETVTAPMSAAIDNLSDEEGQSLISGESLNLEDLPDLDVQALRDLQDEERALALVDLDCYEAEVQAIFDPLRDDFENGLLTEYATEFSALKNIGS